MSLIQNVPSSPVLWTFQVKDTARLYICKSQTFFRAREKALAALGCEREDLILKRSTQ